MCSISDIKTGTETYMSLYPEKSTDSGLRLGNIVPDFGAWARATHMSSSGRSVRSRTSIVAHH
jgi:1-Cys peroxiredoxin 6